MTVKPLESLVELRRFKVLNLQTGKEEELVVRTESAHEALIAWGAKEVTAVAKSMLPGFKLDEDAPGHFYALSINEHFAKVYYFAH